MSVSTEDVLDSKIEELLEMYRENSFLSTSRENAIEYSSGQIVPVNSAEEFEEAIRALPNKEYLEGLIASNRWLKGSDDPRRLFAFHASKAGEEEKEEQLPHGFVFTDEYFRLESGWLCYIDPEYDHMYTETVNALDEHAEELSSLQNLE